MIISIGLLVGSLTVAYSVVNGKRSVGEFVMCKSSYGMSSLVLRLDCSMPSMKR